jgi:polyisoprenoid-binding protein YceI
MTTARATPRIDVPPTGTYRIDPDRSTVTVVGRHLYGLARIRATFGIHDGQIQLSERIVDSAVAAVITTASFASGIRLRDRHVRSPRLLDADRYPQITFATGTPGVRGSDNGAWVLHGGATIHGVTAPVALTVQEVRTADGAIRVHAAARVDRYVFGVTQFPGAVGRYFDVALDVTAGRLGQA